MTKAEAYTILNLKKGSSQKDIKRAFRKLSLKHHPDMKGGNQKAFIRIKEAYDTLANSTQSKPYTSQSQSHEGNRKSKDVHLRAWVVDFGHPVELVPCTFVWHDGDNGWEHTYGVMRNKNMTCGYTVVHTKHVDYVLWVWFKNISVAIHPYKAIPSKRGGDFNVIEYKEEISFFNYLLGKRVKMPPVGDVLKFSISEWMQWQKSVTMIRTKYGIQESFREDHWLFTMELHKRYFNTNIQEVRAIYYLNEEKLNWFQKQIVRFIVWVSNKIEDKKNAAPTNTSRKKED